jgi:hypothetical protein
MIKTRKEGRKEREREREGGEEEEKKRLRKGEGFGKVLCRGLSYSRVSGQRAY